ncbi:TPA: hypothetical protein HA219_00170 [Candidatus Woesearchaeota archaeon]|nr:hypothetical protein [Candidatus Woesearchaeota archaeon]HIH39130.1 hypothetical protein [Candidatus Woesearchaeota archaeon]
MKEKMDPEIKKLVLWRLDTSLPKNLKLSIGAMGTFDRDELKEHVEDEDDIGREIVKMQLKFIKALSTGALARTLAEE